MGRKGLKTKTKEKKIKRQEENAKIAAKQSTVDAAIAMEDAMANLMPFKKYERNGLKLSVQCLRMCDMDKETIDWAFELTRKNMRTLYEDSDWGWNDKQKKEEMLEDTARYLVVRDQDKAPLAVVHFRFDLDADEEVLYCYEIQLEKDVRRKGLGKFLMQILEMIAHKTHMTKVMLTVFNNNHDAHDFFEKTLKYQTDETSPSESMEEALFDEEGYTYRILSKAIGQPKPETKHTNGVEQNGTATIAT